MPIMRSSFDILSSATTFAFKGELGKDGNKFNSHKVLKRLYRETIEYSFLRTCIINHNNIVIVSVFDSDVFAINSIIKRILSFEEVRRQSYMYLLELNTIKNRS
jgi:hypothetical protein